MAIQSTVVREGVSVGLIGATSIAVWFLILDAINGNILGTPELLGNSMRSFVMPGDVASKAGAIIGYTVVHYTLFVVVGLVFSYIVNASQKTPSVLVGFSMLFVLFEMGWFGMTTIIAQQLGGLTWLQVLVANLIAAATMGLYMWRRHPLLPGLLNRALAEKTQEAGRSSPR